MSSTERSDPLIDPEKTVIAKIDRIDGSVFLTLPGGERARLEREDSLATVEEHRPFEEIARYGKGNLLAVVVYWKRLERGAPLYFVHERWAKKNPWIDIDDVLKPGDRVTGVVTANRIPGLFGDAYLVQLDTQAPVCTAAGVPLVWEDDSPVMQPDIRVLLRADDLPGHQGSTAEVVRGRPFEPRLPLETGEHVALLIEKLKTPPSYPLASLLGLIHAQDAAFSAHQGAQDGRSGLEGPTNLGPEGRKRRAQESLGRWDKQEAAWRAALTGKHIVLVDDRPEVHALFAPVLRGYGALVTVHGPVDTNDVWTHARFLEALEGSLKRPFDLLLVDDGLPAAHDGEEVLLEALSRVEKFAAAPTEEVVELRLQPQRVMLMSAHTTSTLSTRDRLLSLGVRGTLRRPLQVEHVAALLDPAAEDPWEWTEGAPKPVVAAQKLEIEALLSAGCNSLQQDYAMLLEVLPGQHVRRVAATASVPAGLRDMAGLMGNNGFKEVLLGLVAERIVELAPRHGDGPRASALSMHWHGLTLSDERGPPAFLLGVGSHRGIAPGAGWAWFAKAVAAELKARQWQQVLEHHANALATGWMAQGYAHEQGSSQENAQAWIHRLLGFAGRARSSGGSVAAEDLVEAVEGLRQHLNAGYSLGQRMLRRQRSRAVAVHLPTWASDLRVQLAAQCKEAQVVLLVSDVPNITAALPEMVLTVAVSNLVLNAVKHHFRQEARWVEMTVLVSPDGSQLHLDVRDNGPGVSPTALAHLFQPGFSLAPEAQQRHGMGLWLSRLLLEEEGGSLVLLENWRGSGARFRISVPMRAA